MDTQTIIASQQVLISQECKDLFSFLGICGVHHPDEYTIIGKLGELIEITQSFISEEGILTSPHSLEVIPILSEDLYKKEVFKRFCKIIGFFWSQFTRDFSIKIPRNGVVEITQTYIANNLIT